MTERESLILEIQRLEQKLEQADYLITTIYAMKEYISLKHHKSWKIFGLIELYNPEKYNNSEIDWQGEL